MKSFLKNTAAVVLCVRGLNVAGDPQTTFGVPQGSVGFQRTKNESHNSLCGIFGSADIFKKNSEFPFL